MVQSSPDILNFAPFFPPEIMSGATLPNPDEPKNPFILLNVHSVTKFDGSNYRQWRTQLESLFDGYGLSSYIDGTTPPQKTVASATNTPPTPNPAFNTWYRQDKLIFSVVASTITSAVSPLLNRVSTTREAWDVLAKSYARPSRGHIKQLRHKLKHIAKGPSSISDYMTRIKTTVDELAILGTIITNEDITDQVIEGLDSTYQPVIAIIDARDDLISFPELLEKLINRELTLAQTDTCPATTTDFSAIAHPTYTRNNSNRHHRPSYSAAPTSQSPATNQNPKNPFKGKCQWCHTQGHTLA